MKIKQVLLIRISLLLTLSFSLLSLQAQTWTQVGEDIDGEAGGDLCGVSVSLNADGSIVAIGAHGNDGNGSTSGHVRIFQNNEGSWTQIGEDIDGEAGGDRSGFSLSLSADGSILAIGAYKNGGNGVESGHVRVFENIEGTWTQIGEDIDGEAADDNSGWSVRLSGDGSILAVGAPNNSENGTASGHVRIFQNDAGSWTQIGDDIDGDAADDQFGYSLSLSSDGTIITIGAVGNDDSASNAGSVKVFQNNAGIWTQIGSNINGEAAEDNSGYSVSINSAGTIVAIGATGNDGNGTDAGHVRIYQNDAGVWTQIGEDIDGEAAGDISGSTLSFNSEGSIIAIGATDNDGNGTQSSGHVRVYRNIAGVWEQFLNDIDGEAAYDGSGKSVSMNSSGSMVAIGATGNDGFASYAGHVRVYINPSAGISNTSKKVVSIYPNPTKGIITLNLTDFKNLSGLNVSISDILGKTILNKTTTQQNETIDLSGFESGIYIISIQTEQEIVTKKIVKE